MGGGRLLSPGTRLGSYRIEALLGRGSTGEVYRATDERLGRAVALKVPPAWLDEDETALERFLAEARAAAALDHPNVVGPRAVPAACTPWSRSARGSHRLGNRKPSATPTSPTCRAAGRSPRAPAPAMPARSSDGVGPAGPACLPA